MKSNLKLNLKVLSAMNEDFVLIEASLLNVQDSVKREQLFKEIRDYRISVEKLYNYYKRLLQNQK